MVVLRIDADTKIDAHLETVFQDTGGIDISSYSNLDPQFAAVASFEVANDILANLEAQDPPDLTASMPDLSMLGLGLGYFSPAGEVRKYNKVVARFNREVGRRRRFMARRAPLELAGLAAQLRALSARTPEHLVGGVMQPAVLADRTLDHDHAPSGKRVYLHESSGWAARYFARTSLLFLTDPPGAAIAIDGQSKGATPYLAADLPVGTRVQVTLTAAKHRTIERTVDVTAVPARFRAITEVMTKGR
jgi:hypothetical protein